MKSSQPVIADDLLAEGFGRYAERWAKEQGASPEAGNVIREAASRVSKATSSGQVYLHLRELASAAGCAGLDRVTLRERLRESHIVGSPEHRGSMPLILDRDDRLYLHRYFDYESRLARALIERRPLQDGVGAIDISPEVVTRLQALFAGNSSGPGAGADWQKLAVVLALLGRLTIISGGPGTGKTTAIVNLFACLLEENPECRIALAAPTGKAAARILEAIRQRSVHLPVTIARKLPQESFTVHRLLGAAPNGVFRHHAGNRLPVDALIVDEASMLDLALATRLIEAVPPHARIILLGDKDQLAAVEAGAIFSELSANPTLSPGCIAQLARIAGMRPGTIRTATGMGPALLVDSVMWLTHSFRFAEASYIAKLAAAISAGDADAAVTTLRICQDDSLSWLEGGAAGPLPEAASQAACAGYRQYIDSVRANVSHAAIAHAFAARRVLCAVRDTARGTQAVNRMIESYFRRTLAHELDPGPRSEWYPGRPVMVLRNDYALNLFNGDIGIVLPDEAQRLMVYFPDGNSGFRALAPVRLPEHETAFAMTIHKSQGSEFDEVLVILPGESNRVLARELLYTAVTRARSRVGIIATAGVLERTIMSRTERNSGLRSRMQEL